MQVRVALPTAGAYAAASWGSAPDTGPTSGTARPGSSDRDGGFALEGSGSAASPAVSHSGSLIADDSVRGESRRLWARTRATAMLSRKTGSGGFIVVALRSRSMTTNDPAQCCVEFGHPSATRPTIGPRRQLVAHLLDPATSYWLSPP